MLRRAMVLACLAGLPGMALAVGTVFTYQGQLRENGAPAQGSYDLQFELQTSIGTSVGAPLVRDVLVEAGRFSVELDFGAGITGADFQLQIGVRPEGSNGAFTLLTPATPLRPTPQAQVAGRAEQAISVVASSITSTSIVNGSVVAADVDASQIQLRVQTSCAAGESLRAINADGSVVCNPPALYGDGSRGDLNVPSGLVSLDSANLQFNNILVAAGASLSVPSGATIKALGSVMIQGSINVDSAAQPSTLTGSSEALPVGPNYFGAEASSGGSESSPTTMALTVRGDAGAAAPPPRLSQSTPAHHAIHPVYLGGGAGGHGASSAGAGAGGGFAAIVARGPISIEAGGGVNALGAAGGALRGPGGGGGGILVLASRTSISNAGTINASGGNGGPGTDQNLAGNVATWGAGGGGGGGIVHLMAPSLVAGTVLVAGGTPGAVPAPTTYAGATFMTSHGGGGGGAGYGSGGRGSGVNGQTNTRTFTWDTPGVLASGGAGLLIQTLADPTTLF